MAAHRLTLLSVLLLLLASILHLGRSDDTSSQLLQGINSYRASLNLSALTENDNAACLAEQLAKQFKGQPCSNSTGSSTVPGTEQQFPNYPDFLNRCHLNASVTQDGAVMPACVPNLDKDLVLSNFTKTQYNENLNSSSFVGAGIADEGDWVVVVLSTNTPTGNYVTNTPTGNYVTATGSGSALKVALLNSLLFLFLGCAIVLMN